MTQSFESIDMLQIESIAICQNNLRWNFMSNICAKWDLRYLSSLFEAMARTAFHFPIRRLIVKSHKVSKPRHLYVELHDHFEIWQANRLPLCQSNFKVMRQFKLPILWLPDLMRSYDKMPYRIFKWGPAVQQAASIVHRGPMGQDSGIEATFCISKNWGMYFTTYNQLAMGQLKLVRKRKD